ncbi:poly hydrolase [Lojkania enalia]|uniref:Poly hydrolase n=1 Tax=Lojkania enalia TaxID=147567 RepID=A0A9P4N414_9PLEO|nr:poly hydrolase [Didymosphaeria enalia]
MVFDKPISTSDVPPKYLEAAKFVGQIPRRVLKADPRVSYALYIPPKFYNPNPAKNSSIPKLPLLINIHGTSRDVSSLNGKLEKFADETPCAVLSPLFPANVVGPNDLDSYKVLSADGILGLRSDLAVMSMMEEIAYIWPGVDMDKVYLMGFSGGGQFVHRFMYLYPELLKAVSVGAPGRVTYLNDTERWPSGTADVPSLFEGRTVRKDLIRALPIQLVVGSKDNVVVGNADFWAWVRNATGVENALEKMDKGRLDTIKELQKLWKDNGIDSQLDIVEGIGHDGNGAMATQLGFMQPLMRTK